MKWEAVRPRQQKSEKDGFKRRISEWGDLGLLPTATGAPCNGTVPSFPKTSLPDTTPHSGRVGLAPQAPPPRRCQAREPHSEDSVEWRACSQQAWEGS